VGTDFQMHGVSFFGYFFCSSKKVTNAGQKEIKGNTVNKPLIYCGEFVGKF
jgi:hypothetical protein